MTGRNPNMTSRIRFRFAMFAVFAFTASLASAQFGSSQGEVRWKSPAIPGNAVKSTAGHSAVSVAENGENSALLVKPVIQPIRLVRYSPQDDSFLDPGFAIPELDTSPSFEDDQFPEPGSTIPRTPIFPDDNGGGFEPVDPDPTPAPIRTPATQPGRTTTVVPRATNGSNGASRLPMTNPTPAPSVSGSTVDNDCDLITHRNIKELRYDITPKPHSVLPSSCPIDEEGLGTFERNFQCRTVHWKASALYAKGGVTYFEDRNLERYGHSLSPALQPLISGGKFFLTIPVLPYKMGLTMPDECVYDLGYYRPGSCAPFQLDPVPISARGALMEAGAVLGGVILFP